MTTTSSHLEGETNFLKAVTERINKDSGAKASFKRALSGEHRHILRVYPFVLPYLEGIHEQQWHLWIFVACLAIFHDQAFEPAPRSFAQSCWDLQNSGKSQGPERRFKTLLDTDLADIKPPFAALVRQIKSKKDTKIPVYYPQLIYDLCFWDHPDQFIQDRWAKDFWRTLPNQEKSSEKAK